LTSARDGCSFSHMPQQTLSQFLIELGEKQSTRKRYRNPNKRAALLQSVGLEAEPVLQPGATLEAMKQKVADQDPSATTKIEWWIRANQAPEVNDQFDLS
jgi:hypothetical protein